MRYSRLAFTVLALAGLVLIGCSKMAADTGAQTTEAPIYTPPAPPLPPVEDYGPALPIGATAATTTPSTSTSTTNTNTTFPTEGYTTASTDPSLCPTMEWIPNKKRKNYDWLDTGFPGAANTMMDCRPYFDDLSVVAQFIGSILKNRRFPLQDNLFSNYGHGFHHGTRGMGCMNKLGKIALGLTSFSDNLQPGALNSWFSQLLQWTGQALPSQGFNVPYTYSAYSFTQPLFSAYVPFGSLGQEIGWSYNPYAPGIGPY